MTYYAIINIKKFEAYCQYSAKNPGGLSSVDVGGDIDVSYHFIATISDAIAIRSYWTSIIEWLPYGILAHGTYGGISCLNGFAGTIGYDWSFATVLHS